MRNSKKRIKVAPIETSLLYFLVALLPVIFLVLAMLTSSLRAEWTLAEDQIPILQGWSGLP